MAPQVVADYTRWFFARLKTIEPIVGAHAFLCGGRFTLADISVGYALLLADYLDISGSFKPHTKEFWLRLNARDAFQRALASEKGAAAKQGIAATPAPLAR